MNMNANVVQNALPIQSTATTEGGVHWLEVKLDNGWDDAKRHAKMVLEFEGRLYCWSCWNSDRNVSVFRTGLPVATVTKHRKA